MGHFSIGKVFLVPSFDLEEKERRKIDRFLLFLDDSGVGDVVARYVRNGTPSGGRPNCNYYRLFAAILYGFAFDRYTVRDLADACMYDLRYVALMEQTFVDYSTVAKFINKVIVPNEREIFALVGKLGILRGYRAEEMVSSKTVADAISALGQLRAAMPEKEYADAGKALGAMLLKAMEYEDKERICGPGRRSYYKTDRDATAMCLKADYYAGLGSNMHAAYNVGALVVRGFVFAYYVSQDRADINCLVPLLEAFRRDFRALPKRVCADAGYGSLANYRYLDRNGIGNYVKSQSWEGNVSGRYPDLYRFDGAKDTITCLGGKEGREVSLDQRHPKKAGAAFFRVDGCNGRPFMPFCKKCIKIG